MQTGENEQALRKIIDLTRICSMVILILHFYYYCHRAMFLWVHMGLLVMMNISPGLLIRSDSNCYLALLIVSLVEAKERKMKISVSLHQCAMCRLIYFSWRILFSHSTLTFLSKVEYI
jgi:hypothetical protein